MAVVVVTMITVAHITLLMLLGNRNVTEPACWMDDGCDGGNKIDLPRRAWTDSSCNDDQVLEDRRNGEVVEMLLRRR